MIGTRQQIARAGNAEIQTGDDIIQPTHLVRNLVTSTVLIMMKRISKIRHLLDTNTMKILMQAWYCPRLIIATVYY